MARQTCSNGECEKHGARGRDGGKSPRRDRVSRVVGLLVGLTLVAPALAQLNPLQDPGFEIPGSVSVGPLLLGKWCGDLGQYVTSGKDCTNVPVIHPFEGTHMLRFLRTEGKLRIGASCDVIQIVDLTGPLWQSRIAQGCAVADASVLVNRVACAPSNNPPFTAVDTSFNLQLWACDTLAHASNLQPLPNGYAISSPLYSDANPNTWEPLSLSLPLPKGTNYLAFHIAAVEDKVDDTNHPELAGQFADKANLTIRSACPTGRTWEDVTPQNACFDPNYPTGRKGHGMGYDPVADLVVMFGGQDCGLNLSDDTWYTQGPLNNPSAPYQWFAVPKIQPPPARRDFGMAWDPNTQSVVIYGGLDSTYTTLGDFWSFSPYVIGGPNWTPINQGPVTPGALSGLSLATDNSTGRLVLTGGKNAAGVYNNNTWEWDGSKWTKKSGGASTFTNWINNPVFNPLFKKFGSSRAEHAMAYHSMFPLPGGVVLFGGQGKFLLFGDTWAWLPGWTNLSNWTPSPRAGHVMAYDSWTPKDVMFWENETWTWDYPAGWMQVFPSPHPGSALQPLDDSAMAYDEANDTIVLFGGEQHPGNCFNCNDLNNETWLAQRCYADFDGDWIPGTSNDSVAFQAALNAGDMCADCNGDGVLDQFDFLCFLNASCP